MLKVKLQHFGHLMRRTDSLGKTLTLGGVGGRGEGDDDKGWDGWMASPTRWTWVWVDSGSWWWTGRPGVLRFMGSQRVGHNWSTELNWTELINLKWGAYSCLYYYFCKISNLSLLYMLSVGLKFCSVKLGGIKKSPWQAWPSTPLLHLWDLGFSRSEISLSNMH